MKLRNFPLILTTALASASVFGLSSCEDPAAPGPDGGQGTGGPKGGPAKKPFSVAGTWKATMPIEFEEQDGGSASGGGDARVTQSDYGYFRFYQNGAFIRVKRSPLDARSTSDGVRKPFELVVQKGAFRRPGKNPAELDLFFQNDSQPPLYAIARWNGPRGVLMSVSPLGRPMAFKQPGARRIYLEPVDSEDSAGRDIELSAAIEQCWERVHASFTPYQNHLVTRGIPGKSVDQFLCKLVAVSCILESTPDGGFDVFFSSPAYFVHFQDGWSQEQFPESSFPHDAFRVFHLEKDGEEWKVVDAGSDVIRGAQRVAPEEIPPPNRSIE